MPTAMLIDAPDITPHRSGTTGIDYVHTFDSGLPGPHVCINAVTHGNEICGAWAVDRLLREQVRPETGSLSFSFANVLAFSSFSGERPENSRWVDEDFNRLWDESTLKGPRNSRELERARELRGFFSTVDYLLDLHSMHTPGPALGLCGSTAGGLDFARRMGVPKHIIVDAGHSAGRRLRDFADFGDENSYRQAYLIECGFHFDEASVDVADLAARRFLALTGVCPTLGKVVAEAEKQQVTVITEVVTIRSDDFRFAADWASMQIIPDKGTLIAHDGQSAITSPHDHCVVVMPAPKRYQRPGMTALRLGRVLD